MLLRITRRRRNASSMKPDGKFPAELKREAINRYYTCLVDVQEKTAQKAFMPTCKFYSQINPEIPEWRYQKSGNGIKPWFADLSEWEGKIVFVSVYVNLNARDIA